MMKNQEVPQEDLPDSSAGSEVPHSDLPANLSNQEVPSEDLPIDEDKYSTPGQQIGSVVEGFAKGIAPGIATAAENKLSEMGVPHLSPEEQLGREAVNPMKAGAANIAGNMTLMAALPEMEIAKFGEVGSKALNGMIQMGLISGGDEYSKALLGQGNPADAVVAHIAGSSAVGLLSGGIFGKAEQLIGKGFKSLEAAKIGKELKGLVAGFGKAASNPGEAIKTLAESNLPQDLSSQAFKRGYKLFSDITGSAAKHVLTTASSVLGYHVAGPYGGVAAPAIEKALERVLAPVATNASKKYLGPTILKAAASGSMDYLVEALDHATKIGKGVQRMSSGIENLFDSGANKAIENYTSEKHNENLNNFIDEGGIEPEIKEEMQDQGIPQKFAEGGSVEPNKSGVSAMSQVFPEQDTLLTATKARMSGYLRSLKPSPIQNKLPYDSDSKDPVKKKNYDRAIDLANQPLTILNKIKKGDLLPSDVTHLTSMYPELHQELSKRMIKRMSEGQLKKEKRPPYHVRQAMSLFLGSSLDSTTTPFNIQAAQNVFAQQRVQKAQAAASSSALSKMDDNLRTPEESRLKKQNKG